MAPKILIISSYSGSMVSVRPEAEMVLRLKKQGMEIDVMSDPQSTYADIFRENGIHIYPYQPKRKISLREIRYIRKVLCEGNYDIIHVFNNKAVTNAVFAARKLPVKMVTYRGYTGHLLWYKPTSHISHLHPKVNKITCVSDGVKNHVRRQLFFNKDKAVTLYKGHDPEWYNDIQPYTRKQLGIPENAFLIGCVANARPMKGIPNLIKASYHLRDQNDIHFLLIGKNMNTNYHRKWIRESPLKRNFHIPGFKKDVLNHLAACDVMVLPSVKGEGLSKVTIEAMSTGLPVIATNIGGNPELVLHEQTGLLVDPKAPKQIAKAITTLRDNEAMRKKLGEAARQHIMNNYHIDQTVKEIKNFYESLIRER
ncbi:MAG: glycosyltransferase family 4 protein [Bacteroidales bacterium]|nr:glycosyltransferase family 4 protein [Bacteroidales bacterium]